MVHKTLDEHIAELAGRGSVGESPSPGDESRTSADETSLAKALQFEFWGDRQRVAPNELLRSALFTVRNQNTARDYCKRKELAVLGGGDIRYTGQELRQDDHDVWLELLHMSRSIPLGNAVEFERAEFLRRIGWSKAVRPSKRYYDKLFDSLERLSATNLLIRSKRLGRGIGVSLIAKFEYQDDEGKNLRRWRIWLDPEIRDLFAPHYHTRLYWEQRQQLSDMGKWLHGFFGSHRAPFPQKVTTIRDHCGSTAKHLNRFRATLKKALDELVEVGFLASWSIDGNDCVVVKRIPAKQLANQAEKESSGEVQE